MNKLVESARVKHSGAFFSVFFLIKPANPLSILTFRQKSIFAFFQFVRNVNHLAVFTAMTALSLSNQT
ncbi:hypothetical protein ABMB67_004173 [Halalkalibacter oceani]